MIIFLKEILVLEDYRAHRVAKVNQAPQPHLDALANQVMKAMLVNQEKKACCQQYVSIRK